MTAMVAGPLPNSFMFIPGDQVPSSWHYPLPQDGCWEEQPGLQQMQNGTADCSRAASMDRPARPPEVSDEDLAGDGYEYASIEFSRIGQALMNLIHQLQSQLLLDRQRLYAIHCAHQVGKMVSSPKSASQAQPQYSEQDVSNDSVHEFSGAVFRGGRASSSNEEQWPEFIDNHVAAEANWESLHGWPPLDPAVPLKASGGHASGLRKQSPPPERPRGPPRAHYHKMNSSKRARKKNRQRVEALRGKLALIEKLEREAGGSLSPEEARKVAAKASIEAEIFVLEEHSAILEEAMPIHGERRLSVVESPYISGDTVERSMEDPPHEDCSDTGSEGVPHTCSMTSMPVCHSPAHSLSPTRGFSHSETLTQFCKRPKRKHTAIWADVQDNDAEPQTFDADDPDSDPDPDFLDTPEEPEAKPEMRQQEEQQSEKEVQEEEHEPEVEQKSSACAAAAVSEEASPAGFFSSACGAALEGTEIEASSSRRFASEERTPPGRSRKAQQKQEEEEKNQRQDSQEKLQQAKPRASSLNEKHMAKVSADSDVPPSDKSRATGATSSSQTAKLPKSIAGGSDAPVRWPQAKTNARESSVRKSASSDKRELPSMEQIKVLVSGSWAGTRGEKYEIDLDSWTCVKQNKDFYNTYKLRMSEELGVIYWQSSTFVLHLRELKNDPNHVFWRGAADGCVKWVWTKQKTGNTMLDTSCQPWSSK